MANKLLAALLLLAAPALVRAGSTPNYATPTYQLTGGNYQQEAPAINQMFHNVQVETQYLQGQVGGGSASGNTMTTNTDQTVSGAKTFTGGVTIGGALNSTATYSSMLIGGDWTPIAEAHPNAASSFWFYNLVSTAPTGCANYPTYKIHINLTQNTTVGTLQVQFGNPSNNLDTGAGQYADNYSGEGCGSAGRGGASVSSCRLEYATQRVNRSQEGDFIFSHLIGDDRYIQGVLHGQNEYSGDPDDGCIIVGDAGCFYPRTANASPPAKAWDRVKIFTSAGTFTGDAILYVKCQP